MNINTTLFRVLPLGTVCIDWSNEEAKDVKVALKREKQLKKWDSVETQAY